MQQEGSLCAQHCLNALLQGPYFTAVDLATLAQQMDDQERERMAENGVDSEEYRNFIQVCVNIFRTSLLALRRLLWPAIAYWFIF